VPCRCSHGMAGAPSPRSFTVAPFTRAMRELAEKLNPKTPNKRSRNSPGSEPKPPGKDGRGHKFAPEVKAQAVARLRQGEAADMIGAELGRKHSFLMPRTLLKAGKSWQKLATELAKSWQNADHWSWLGTIGGQRSAYKNPMKIRNLNAASVDESPV
jgi:hypothetical protein